MASTNQTTHYDLSQYTANDKPTYLVDYNGDMSKIDAGIYSAESKALQNESDIGTLSNLDTTAKNNLVSAINEVNTQAGNNATAISNLTTSVGANTGNIGTMANLQTTAKDNLVNAVNELKGVNDTQSTKIANIENNLALNNVIDLPINNSTSTGIDRTTFDEIDSQPLKFAHNDNYSIFKLYGILQFTVTDYTSKITFSNIIPSAYRPLTDINIRPIGMYRGGDGGVRDATRCVGTIKANGDIEIFCYNQGNVGNRVLFLLPCVYFLADFGDTPASNI